MKLTIESYDSTTEEQFIEYGSSYVQVTDGEVFQNLAMSSYSQMDTRELGAWFRAIRGEKRADDEANGESK